MYYIIHQTQLSKKIKDASQTVKNIFNQLWVNSESRKTLKTTVPILPEDIKNKARVANHMEDVTELSQSKATVKCKNDIIKKKVNKNIQESE